MCLQLSGEISVETSASGQEAIETCMRWSPDLVLMDVMMPGIDGVTAYKMMKEREDIRDIPVVFVTARVQRAEVNEYLDLGAVGVIEKPFAPMELADQALAFIR